MAPADGPPRMLQTADITTARALVGGHVSAEFSLENEPIPRDQREKVVRSCVERLLAEVRELLSTVSPDGLLEQLLAANERIVAESEHSRAVLPARLATYPAVDSQGRLRDEAARASQAAVCCRFLAEYVAAQPPTGEQPWGVHLYDRAMALTGEMISWAYLDDAFVYHMSDVGLLLNEDGELRLEEQDRYEMGRVAYFDVHVAAQRETMQRIFMRRFDSGPSQTEASELVERINALMFAEAGATLTELGELLHAASAYAAGQESEIVAIERSAANAILAAELEWPSEKVDRALSYLTIGPRPSFLKPPSGNWSDVVPSRFARRWSLNRRPFIARGDELLWGRRQVLVALNVMLGQIASGRFQSLAESTELRDELSLLASEEGKKFEHEVAEVFRADSRFVVAESVAALGGHKLQRANGQSLGDIDVLVADTVARVLYGVECKDLAGALTPSEVAGELSEHFDEEGTTSSTKHAERVAWLEKRRPEALHHLGIADNPAAWRVAGMFVTGRPVMAPYIRDVQFEIVAIDKLSSWIAARPQPERRLKRKDKRRRR